MEKVRHREDVRARKSLVSTSKMGASLHCSQDTTRDLYFSGSAETMQGPGTERWRPVSGGVIPSSLHRWDTTIIEVAPEDLCGMRTCLYLQGNWGDCNWDSRST